MAVYTHRAPASSGADRRSIDTFWVLIPRRKKKHQKAIAVQFVIIFTYECESVCDC